MLSFLVLDKGLVLVSYISRRAISKQSLINFQQKFINPRKLYIAFAKLRASYSLIALTFLGSICTPFLTLIINPKYFIDQTLNLYFKILSQSLALSKHSRTCYTQAQCQDNKLLVQTRMLLIYIEQNLSRSPFRHLLIYFQKELEVFTKLKGVTLYLYSL